MKKHPGTLQKLPLPQLLVVLLIVSILGLYQLWNQGPGKQSVLTTPAGQNLGLATPASVEQQVPTREPAASIAATTSPVEKPTGNFDFYVLALSWSPDYCASNGSNDPQQCSIGKKLGFVLHGLWPQNNKGYPSSCSTEKLPLDVKTQFPALYPSQSLYDHEWEKHGTCSGLSPQQYLSFTKQLKESVVIPAIFKAPAAPIRFTTDRLKKEFLTANSNYTVSTIAVICSGSGRYLKEVYVCFTQDGQPTICSAEVLKTAAKSCQNLDFLVRNTR